MHPMIPFLTGWLTMAVYDRGKPVLKITDVRCSGTDSFDVEFASGLVLTVRVEQSPRSVEREGL